MSFDLKTYLLLKQANGNSNGTVGGQQIQADWNQEDETQVDFIKNKPNIKDLYYTESTLITLVDNLTSDDYNSGNAPACNFIVGETYDVIWNGVLYKDLVCQNEDGWNVIASEDRGHPFHIDDDGGNDLYINPSDNEPYVVSIIHHGEYVHQIDEKYIPDSIARISDIPEIPEIEIPEIEIPNPDWRASKGESGYIKNRTHYETFTWIDIGFTNISVTTSASPSTGTTSDGIAFSHYYTDPFYVSSANIFPLSIGELVCVIINGEQYIYTTEQSVRIGDSTYDKLPIQLGYVSGDQHRFIIYGTKPSETLTVSVYKLEESIVHQLDEKFIPDTIARVDEVRTHYTENILIDAIPYTTFNSTSHTFTPASWLSSNLTSSLQLYGSVIQNDYDFPPGEYIVTVDGVKYTYTSTKDFDKEGWGSFNAYHLPIYIDPWSESGKIFVGFTYGNKNTGTHTIEMYRKDTIIHQLDEKYIPSTIARINDIPEIPEAVIPNWSASEGEDGYINNRTHYIKEILTTENIGFEEIELTSAASSSTTPGFEGLYQQTASAFTIQISSTYDYIMKYDGKTYRISKPPQIIAPAEYPDLPFYIYSSYNSAVGARTYIYFKEPDTTHTVAMYAITRAEIVPLDEQFIPKTIARVGELPKSDWGQSSEQSSGYIKNRTHYVKDILEDTTWNNVDVTTDTSTTIYTGNGAVKVAYTVIATSKDDPLFINFINGDTYLVIIDGIEYRMVAVNSQLGDVINGDDIIEIECNNSTSNVKLYTKNNYETHTISIKKIIGQEIVQLDEKFIPNTIARVGESPILTSPSGKKFRLTVSDDGALSATEI